MQKEILHPTWFVFFPGAADSTRLSTFAMHLLAFLATSPQGQWLHLLCLLSQMYGRSYKGLGTRGCTLYPHTRIFHHYDYNYIKARESLPSDIFSFTVMLPRKYE